MIAIMQDKGITLRQVTHVVCDRLSAFPCPPCLNDCRHQNPFELEGQILIVTVPVSMWQPHILKTK